MYALGDLTGHCYVHFAVVFDLRKATAVSNQIIHMNDIMLHAIGKHDIKSNWWCGQPDYIIVAADQRRRCAEPL